MMETGLAHLVGHQASLAYCGGSQELVIHHDNQHKNYLPIIFLKCEFEYAFIVSQLPLRVVCKNTHLNSHQGLGTAQLS